MKTNNENVEETQGVETTTEGKKQKVSVSYTLRAAGENVKKLQELELITKEEADGVRELLKTALMKHVGL